MNIEARSMIDIASKQIIPVGVQYTTAWHTPSTRCVPPARQADISVQNELLCEVLLIPARGDKAALKELTEVTEEASGIPQRSRKELSISARMSIRPWRRCEACGQAGNAGGQGDVAHAVLRRSAV